MLLELPSLTLLLSTILLSHPFSASAQLITRPTITLPPLPTNLNQVKISSSELAAISAEYASKFGAPGSNNLGIVNSIIASANQVLSGFSLSNPSLQSKLPTIDLPQFSQYTRSVTTATASVFTGPYVADIVSQYSAFVSTRSSGQQFSVGSPTLAPPTNGPLPTTSFQIVTTGPQATGNGASTAVIVVTQPGGQAGAQTSAGGASTTSAAATTTRSQGILSRQISAIAFSATFLAILIVFVASL